MTRSWVGHWWVSSWYLALCERASVQEWPPGLTVASWELLIAAGALGGYTRVQLSWSSQRGALSVKKQGSKCGGVVFVESQWWVYSAGWSPHSTPVTKYRPMRILPFAAHISFLFVSVAQPGGHLVATKAIATLQICMLNQLLKSCRYKQRNSGNAFQTHPQWVDERIRFFASHRFLCLLRGKLTHKQSYKDIWIHSSWAQVNVFLYMFTFVLTSTNKAKVGEEDVSAHQQQERIEPGIRSLMFH